MAAPSPLPGPSSGAPDRDLELYKMAVEEYRFQATFNWSRTQYLLAFNAAILAAGSAVAARPGKSAALVFLLGAVAAGLSLVVTRTQHGYYAATRDRVRRLEDHLGLPQGQRMDTTSTLGGRQQKVKIKHVIAVLFAALGIAHLVGAVLVAVG